MKKSNDDALKIWTGLEEEDDAVVLSFEISIDKRKFASMRNTNETPDEFKSTVVKGLMNLVRFSILDMFRKRTGRRPGPEARFFPDVELVGLPPDESPPPRTRSRDSVERLREELGQARAELGQAREDLARFERGERSTNREVRLGGVSVSDIEERFERMLGDVDAASLREIDVSERESRFEAVKEKLRRLFERDRD